MAGRSSIRREAVADGYSRERLLTELTADLGRPVMARQPMPTFTAAEANCRIGWFPVIPPICPAWDGDA
jgi:hypothetical protein